jgi:putative heme transporter
VADAARALHGTLGTEIGEVVGGIVSAAAGVVTVLILASFLVFFFLRDGDKAWVWMFEAASDSKRERITTAGQVALARAGEYLRATTLLALVVGVSNLAFMWLLGVPLAGTLAVLAFLASYIPYFGGLVVAAVILLVTLAALGPVSVLVMLVLMAVRNLIVGYALRPGINGKTVKIHPAVVLLVLPAGYELAGVIGLFAAVPVTVVLVAVASATVAIIEPVPHPPLPGLVPAWLDSLAQWSWRLLLTFALIALVVAVFIAVPLVVVPVVLGLILAATLEPLVHALVRRGSSRARASAIAVGGGSLAVILLLALTIAELVGQAGEIRDTAVAGAKSASAALGGHLGLGVEAAAAGGGELVRVALAIGEGLAGVAVVTILSALLAFYLLRDGSRLWERAIARAQPTVAPALHAAGGRAFGVLSGYMMGTAAISFVGAASQWLIMVVLGLPLALPVFVLSFVLNFIPYIGGFISTGAAFLIAVAVGSPADVLVMAAWTIVFNIVTGNIVSPLVYGKTVDLHPAVVLVAIPAGGAVAGVLGMFLVVPAIGVVAATWRTALTVLGARLAPGTTEPDPAATSASSMPGDEAALPATA